MKNRGPRFDVQARARFYRVDELVSGRIGDLSRNGAFVHTDAWLPINGEVDLQIQLNDGRYFSLPARVAHCLHDDEAQATGRNAGIGFALINHSGGSEQRFGRFVDQLQRQRQINQLNAGRVLLVTQNRRLQQRLDNSLRGRATLGHAFSESEAYEMAAAGSWDTALVDADLWDMSVIQNLSSGALCEPIPVLVVGVEHDEKQRLELYRKGARDCLPRPFSDEELIMRIRGLTDQLEPPAFAGDMAKLQPPAVLSLLEMERRTGVLSLYGPSWAVHMGLSEGALCHVETPSGYSDQEALMQALSWNSGRFVFREDEGLTSADRTTPVSAVLMDLAIRSDEARR